MSQYQFQTEVSSLLDIVTKSLYSERGVFLRELISNASDACDRLRYDALIKPELLSEDSSLRIAVIVDRERSSISIVDNGIGMSHDELLENLGTIARSGTALIRQQLEAARSAANSTAANSASASSPTTSNDRPELIGQFGIGFYASFGVAKQVEVRTRRAGSDQGWYWSSDGQETFTITDAENLPRGTAVELILRDDAHEFLDEDKINQLVRKYCDHITLPVTLGQGENAKVINNAVALWARAKHTVTSEQYTEFYRHLSQSFGEPWLTIHWRAEGHFEYACLLFIPQNRPWDMPDPQRKHQVKLYVRRVFIADDVPDFIPGYLRFLCGVVDSADLPLNVSRELLQNNQLLAKIKSGLVKRVLHELTLVSQASDSQSLDSQSLISKDTEPPAGDGTDPVAANDPNGPKSPAYQEFWEKFGSILKEGLYEDESRRHELLELVRFRSTLNDGWLSLKNYLARMLEGQDAIYYLSGEHLPSLTASPQLEGFKARGIVVLLLSDAVDEFWIPSVGFYQDKPLRSVTRGLADLSRFPLITSPQAVSQATSANESRLISSASLAGPLSKLIAHLQLVLRDQVKEVRPSDRLVDSAVCLVADEGDAMDLRMERLLRQHHQLHMPTAKRILEINPAHPLIQRMAVVAERSSVDESVDKPKDSSKDESADESSVQDKESGKLLGKPELGKPGLSEPELIDDIGWLLLEQARILERETIADPIGFTKRLSRLMLQGLE